MAEKLNKREFFKVGRDPSVEGIRNTWLQFGRTGALRAVQFIEVSFYSDLAK